MPRLSAMSRPALLLLALLISSIIVVIGNAATSLMLGSPIMNENSFGGIDAPDVAILHLLATGLPMFVLASLGIRRTDAWLIAAGLQSAFWCYFVWQVWQDSLTGFAGGANIGLGLIMLASPFVTLLVLGGWQALRRIRQ